MRVRSKTVGGKTYTGHGVASFWTNATQTRSVDVTVDDVTRSATVTRTCAAETAEAAQACAEQMAQADALSVAQADADTAARIQAKAEARAKAKAASVAAKAVKVTHAQETATVDLAVERAKQDLARQLP